MSLNSSCFDEPNHEYMHDSDLELGGKITLLAGQINAATYLFLKMLAEFDRRRGWVSRHKKRMPGAFCTCEVEPRKATGFPHRDVRRLHNWIVCFNEHQEMASALAHIG
ncbi:MAG: hypothetical protein ACI8WB_002913 [Phenylobacterium sp.]|jgi:hypothetical protein